MGNKKKKEKYKNIENNDKNFHKGKKISGKNYNIKKENEKNQKMELKEEKVFKTGSCRIWVYFSGNTAAVGMEPEKAENV